MRRFAADERGGAVAIFALALIPVLAAAGAAVDYARAAKMRSNLQSIVDAAVLTGLKAPASRRAGAAEAHARAALAREGVLIDTLSFTPTTSQGLRGRVKIRLSSVFGGVLGTSGIDIAAGAEGFVRSETSSTTAKVCIMLMDPSAAETLRVNGGVTVAAPHCEIHVHTSANVGAVFNGNATIDAKRICLRGPGYIANGQPKLGPLETGCAVAGDPFANQIPKPSSLGCTFTNRVFEAPRGRQATELEPGVYCGATLFKGRHEIRLKPGLYVIKDGMMTVDGGSSIIGSGVTFFLADANASLQINGASTVDLSAPAASQSAYRDILIFEPNGLQRSAIAFEGASTHRLKGLVYLPSRNLTFNGGSGLEGDAVTMVVNALTINGAGKREWKLEAAPRSIPSSSAAGTGAEIILRY